MPNQSVSATSHQHATVVLAEALRRVDAGIPDHEVDLDALRRALETEMAKGPVPLVTLIKFGRRWALDRIRRQKYRETARRRTA